MFLATTRVGILRGSTESDLGDTVDDNTDAALVAVLADMPASLIEKDRDVYDPASGTRRTVRVVTARIPVAVPHPTTGVATPVVVLDGDRLKDRRTGIVYAILEQVRTPRSLGGASSLTLDLEGISGA